MPVSIDKRRAIAKRMREVAAGLTDPTDIKAAEDYADELEQGGYGEQKATKRRAFILGTSKLG